MGRDSERRLHRSAAEIREQLEKLKVERPPDFHLRSARLLKDLDRVLARKQRYALT